MGNIFQMLFIGLRAVEALICIIGTGGGLANSKHPWKRQADIYRELRRRAHATTAYDVQG